MSRNICYCDQREDYVKSCLRKNTIMKKFKICNFCRKKSKSDQKQPKIDLQAAHFFRKWPEPLIFREIGYNPKFPFCPYIGLFSNFEFKILKIKF